MEVWNQQDSSSGLRILVLIDLELGLIFLELVSLFRNRIKKFIILKNWSQNWIPQLHLRVELELKSFLELEELAPVLHKSKETPNNIGSYLAYKSPRKFGPDRNQGPPAHHHPMGTSYNSVLDESQLHLR